MVIQANPVSQLLSFSFFLAGRAATLPRAPVGPAGGLGTDGIAAYAFLHRGTLELAAEAFVAPWLVAGPSPGLKNGRRVLRQAAVDGALGPGAPLAVVAVLRAGRVGLVLALTEVLVQVGRTPGAEIFKL